MRWKILIFSLSSCKSSTTWASIYLAETADMQMASFVVKGQIFFYYFPLSPYLEFYLADTLTTIEI